MHLLSENPNLKSDTLCHNDDLQHAEIEEYEEGREEEQEYIEPDYDEGMESEYEEGLEEELEYIEPDYDG